MLIPNQNKASKPRSTAVQTPVAPRGVFVRAVSALASTVPGLEVVYGNFGEVRALVAPVDGTLFPKSTRGTARATAKEFLRQIEVKRALGLQNVTLEYTGQAKFPTFTRVDFKQTATIGSRKFDIRGGSIQIVIDNAGKVVAVNSTVREGTKPKTLGKIISVDTAVAAAKAELSDKTADVKLASSKLVLSSHEDKMDLVYELTVSVENIPMFFLVMANTGEVVHQDDVLLHIAKRANASVPVPGSAIIGEPTLTTPINDQFHDVILDDLPDPKVLANQRFKMLVQDSTKKWVPVKAKADGTFKFDPNNVAEQSMAHAVTAFFGLNEQMKIMERLGSQKQTRVIPVYVDDPSVQDNAYFNPSAYEIHLGLGTTRLAHFLSLACEVEWHEDGHHLVYLNTPAKDLPGTQGRAINEGFGGDSQALVMCFIFRAKYAKELGITQTKADIQNDKLDISPFTLPPDGIRSQTGNAQVSQSTGEEHHDGLVPGQAAGSILKAFATADGVEIIDGLESFARFYIATLALVPAHNVMYTDLLRAMLTADQNLYKGAHKDLITKSFAAHGVSLNAPTPPAKKDTEPPVEQLPDPVAKVGLTLT